MPHTLRQHLFRFVALAALAFATPATAESCSLFAIKCFGIDWKTATATDIENINVNARDERGLTPLDMAVVNDASPDVLETLIRNGANVNNKNKDGWTPLHHTARYNGNPDVVDLLVRNGANVNARNNPDLPFSYGGMTPLHKAIDGNRAGIAKALIRNGANVNAKSTAGWTPLHLSSNIEIVKILVRNGANLNSRSRSGWTPLHEAAYRGQGDILGFLVQSGANINARTEDALTALHVIATSPMVPMAEFELSVRQAEESNIQGWHEDMKRYFKEDLNRYAKELETVKKQIAKAIDVLINNGLSIHEGDADGNTPLHVAAEERFPYNVNLLIKKGADINARNQWGRTPLHKAAASSLRSNEAQDTLSSLISNGANVKARDQNGKIALEIGKENPTLYKSDAYWLLNDATYN